ncbi:MAG: putative DNA helicase II [Nitrospinaceae bacterium]|nr:MAG: putative DNA helicase II [Nitrospinaceae bacterium]
MKWNKGLEGTALKIAKTDSNPLRVMAGQGTGKTFAMKRRVARLLEEGTSPKKILAVTFTRTAASDLLKELNNLGVEGCEKIKVGTLHAFCFGILLGEDVLSYLGRFPRPLITSPRRGVPHFEAAPLIEDLKTCGAFGGKRDCIKRINAFEAAWARLQSDDPGWPMDSIDRAFHKGLIEWLMFHHGMLIGELIPLTLRYLRNNPECDDLRKFSHVIVDEYQDLNKAEQVLLDVISEAGRFAIVGDEDQSIYGFRFAHPSGIREFDEIHTTTHDESLDECRRCPYKVVELANTLILHNHPAGTENRLKPFPGNPEGELNIVQWKNDKEEIKGLATYIEHLINERSFKPEDILILTPRRFIGYGIRDILGEKEIPVHSFYHEEALEFQEAQEAFCLLNLFIHKNDRVALRYWLGCGSPSWNGGQYKKLRSFCEESGRSPLEVLERVLNRELEIKGISKLLERFEILKSRLPKLESKSLRETVDLLFPENFKWAKILREASILKLKELEDDEEKEDLSEKLFDYLKTIISQPEMPEEGEFLRIMSLHKSKGLTNKVVIVAGCVEGFIPFRDQKETKKVEIDRQIEEQRRLFYVAMTRSKEILVLSSFKQIRRKDGHQQGAVMGRGGSKIMGNTVTSPFWDDIGPTAPRMLRGQEWVNANFR